MAQELHIASGTASTPDGRWTNTDNGPPAGGPDDKPADADDAARLADEAQHRPVPHRRETLAKD